MNDFDEKFELDDIEDAIVIIKAKGKHWSILANEKNCTKEEAKEYRVALVKALLSMEDHVIVTPSLEDKINNNNER